MFIIYYGDDTVLTVEDGNPWQIESERHGDVQVIVQPHEDCVWSTLCNADFYVWDSRGDGDDYRWWGCDHYGLYDYLSRPGKKAVLFGRSITNERYNLIFQRAQREMKKRTGYEKGAFAVGERHP